MRERHTANLASYLILERDGKILMMLRANTGYMDGMYQMPSGHIEQNEYPMETMIREAKEEVGIDLKPEDLEFIHTCYRINKGDATSDWINFYFKATKWKGEVVNAEPEKCDGLLWVPMDALPENTVDVVKQAVEHIRKGLPLSQIGRA